MPRMILANYKAQYRKLGTLISGTVFQDEKSMDDIGRIIGMCSKSAGKYVKNPQELSLAKLLKLCRALQIPIEEVRECLRY